MNYYDVDKIEIIDRIDTIISTIESRLIPTFNSIEEEAKEIEKKRFDELGTNFNPDTMDIGSCYDDAHSEGVEHYVIQNEMKQEFLNHQATLLFHIFEKDCKKMCPILYNNGIKLKEKLEEMGIQTNTNSNWNKINKELRLISNVIKHGEGHSYNKLKILRADLFKDNFRFLLTSDIEISLNDIKAYGEKMKNFWIEFFDIVLPSSQ